MGRLVFVGDVHLDRDDPDLEGFLSFLDGLGRTARRIVFLGDLFNVWLGRRELEQPHHAAVLDKLRQLRSRGVKIAYVEGNRDFHIGTAYGGDALDLATRGALEEEQGGTRLLATHGDLVNVRDLRYRVWRAVSHSAPVWWAFNRLSAPRRVRLAESLERRLRATNLEYKREFPESAVRRYAAQVVSRGRDVVVLGHFHVERDLLLAPPHPPGRVLVLPLWKKARRHLEIDEAGNFSWVNSAV
jgi:UDP-2,3-diacylglucosamine hydrolase